MTEDLKTQKQHMREEAKRARGLMSLDVDGYKHLSDLFFKHIPVQSGNVVAAYWPKGRELDPNFIMDECHERGAIVALPTVQGDSRILKFAAWDNKVEMAKGPYGILEPKVSDDTQFVSPDIFIVPLLAFDRKGYRLGYGGGYYDATLAHYAKEKNILKVGIAYARQACLFNLPTEEHDLQMDWIITEQGAHQF